MGKKGSSSASKEVRLQPQRRVLRRGRPCPEPEPELFEVRVSESLGKIAPDIGKEGGNGKAQCEHTATSETNKALTAKDRGEEKVQSENRRFTEQEKGKGIAVEENNNPSPTRASHPPHPGAAGKKSFASLFSDNRNIKKAEPLKFHEDVKKGRVKISKEDVMVGQKEWEATLIGVVPGNPIPIHALRGFIREHWKVKEPRISSKDNGVYLFRFSSTVERDWVLSHGPWHFAGTRPILLKSWNPGMKVSWEAFDKVPLWVCLPDLDPSYFNFHVLGKVGSAIGKPICMDECTEECLRVAYARLLIEVSAEEALCTEIELEDELDQVKMQKVVFEWKPQICRYCMKFGHIVEKCRLAKVSRSMHNVGGSRLMWKPVNQNPEITPDSNEHKNGQDATRNEEESSECAQSPSAAI